MAVLSSVEEVAAAVPIPAPHATAFGLMSGLTTCPSLGVLDIVFMKRFLGASDIQKLPVLFQSHSTTLVS